MQPLHKKKKKRKSNLTKLCSEMNKLTNDAVDKEIIKRFKIIIDSADEDISKGKKDQLLTDPFDADINSFHESLQPYVKHYIFMLKRTTKISEKTNSGKKLKSETKKAVKKVSKPKS